MGLPEAGENIRSAPVRALRGFFSGIGQLLMAADRLREEEASPPPAADDNQAASLATNEGRRSSNVRLLPPTGIGTAAISGSARLAPEARPKPASPALSGRKARAGRAAKPAEPPRFRSLDQTGNVRMLTDQDIADLAADALERGETATVGSKPAVSAVPNAWAEDSEPVWAEAVPAWSSWSTNASLPAVELPIAGYDELTLPSLRARLRQLNVDQLEILLSYERSQLNRDDVVTMFERRITKLSELDE